MIGRISLLLLLAHATVAFAQPLYKWTEANGSITFSPTPPASGIEFEVISEPNPVAAAPEDSPLPARATNTSVLPEPGQSISRVEYAPGNPRDLPYAISRSPAGTAVQPVNTGVAVIRQGNAASDDSDVSQSASDSAANYKQSRCQDLKKRVTSLERRLKSRLTPEDMDNTVMHMARYQRSHDQYCAQ
jgi:hypothetical protein